MIDLLPCPFCGKHPSHFDKSDPGGKYGFVSCCCTGPEVRIGRSDEETWQLQAAVLWNERANLGDTAFKQKAKEIGLFFFHVVGWLCVIFIAWLGINVLGTLHAEAAESAKVTIIGTPSAWREACLARKKFVEDVRWLQVKGKRLEEVLEDYDDKARDNDFDEDEILELKKMVIAAWNLDSGVETPGAWVFRVCMTGYYKDSSLRIDHWPSTRLMKVLL